LLSVEDLILVVSGATPGIESEYAKADQQVTEDYEENRGEEGDDGIFHKGGIFREGKIRRTPESGQSVKAKWKRGR
jgi:hypothetical protein